MVRRHPRFSRGLLASDGSVPRATTMEDTITQGGASIDDRVLVLHVDDEQQVCELTEAFLERITDRFDVRTDTDPGKVLDRISADPIDCIISDYQMPGMDGIELLSAVREEYPNLPYIPRMVSSSTRGTSPRSGSANRNWNGETISWNRLRTRFRTIFEPPQRGRGETPIGTGDGRFRASRRSRTGPQSNAKPHRRAASTGSRGRVSALCGVDQGHRRAGAGDRLLGIDGIGR